MLWFSMLITTGESRCPWHVFERGRLAAQGRVALSALKKLK
jgi:hypothetical protein